MAPLHYHRREGDDPQQNPPGGMTHEQLDFFTEQTLRAVNKGVRKYRNQAILGFVALVVGLVLVLSDGSHRAADTREAIINSGRAVAVEGCNRDFLDRQNFRDLLERLKQAAEISKTATPDQKRQAVAFYDAQLRRFALPDCRESERLLTADPDAHIPVIAPYYNGAPYLPLDKP